MMPSGVVGRADAESGIGRSDEVDVKAPDENLSFNRACDRGAIDVHEPLGLAGGRRTRCGKLAGTKLY